MSIDLLIVGPESRATGGVARYVTEQRHRLPDDVEPRVHDVGTEEWETTAGFLRAALTSVVDALRFPFRDPPEVVHVHSSHRLAFYRAAWYVLFAALVWRCRVVLHVHGSSFDEFVDTDSRALRAFQAAVFAATDAVVVLSEYWRDQLSRVVPAHKLVVVPNAIDPGGYEPTFDGEPHVTFVSNHVERKGIEEFAEAVDRLQRNGHSFRVSIAGDGPLSDRAADLADTHEEVEYLGYVSEERKRDLLDESTIYVLPTYAEGLPIALLEGMAGGNAVLTTGVGSIPEVVDEENGRLVEPGDADELTDALAELVDQHGETGEMGRRNRRLVAEQYSWSSTIGQLTALYRTLTDRETNDRLLRITAS